MSPQLLALALLAAPGLRAAPRLELVSVERIWNQAPHNAFGDIVHYRGQWFAVFREGQWHVAKAGQEDDGKLRVIVSRDGARWSSAALIAEQGIDLRDPHFSVTGDGRLMIVCGGSEYPGGVYKGRQPRVLFSSDDVRWTEPRKVLERGHWLWRVTWHKGRAWGISKYGSPSKEMPESPRRQDLVSSADGVTWKIEKELGVPGGDESTVRFLRDGRMAVLMRRSAPDGDLAMIGTSRPPYRDFEWNKASTFIGGPNFIVLPSGTMAAGGRHQREEQGKRVSRTALGILTPAAYEPSLILPSSGDSSYPGFVWRDGLLWTLYYSSHEGKAAIYLAKVRVRE